MVTLYYKHLHSPLHPSELDIYLNRLPAELVDRVKRFRNWNDAQACLFGKLLLLKGLSDLNVNKSLSELKYTKYNRPFFDDVSLDFNISHSGHWVVCALSDEGTIGVDIEEVLPVEIAVFQTQFHSDEWDSIVSATDMKSEFYTYWTKKEAAIKADGRGLHVPLKKVYVYENVVYVENNLYKLCEIDLAINVKCYVATSHAVDSLQIHHNCPFP